MNISNIRDCYGCGVCATVCGRHIIEISLNSDGFYVPHITDPKRCTDCSLCIDVCSYSHVNLSLKVDFIKSYGGWSKDGQIRRKCSSGGIGFELGKYLISQGYKVCGVKYDVDKERAEHYIASTVEELVQSIGSKYIQSYTVDGFKAIDRRQKYLVTGSPCQIDSFRRYICKFKKEDNFILMDFFCHGVPSMLAWKKYVKWVETKVGKLTYVSWRNKFTGWHDSWAMSINGKEKSGDKVDWQDSYNLLIREKKGFLNSRLSQGDMFYKLFLSDACLGKACYEKCKFKYKNSSADIRIGDAWGSHYQSDEAGVNAVIAFTEKGDELLHSCNVILEEQPFDVVAEGQMKTMPQRGFKYKVVMDALHSQYASIEQVCSKMDSAVRQSIFLQRILHPKITLKNIIRRIKGEKK